MEADTAVPQPDETASVLKAFHILTDVQQWLQSQAAGSDPSTTDAQLMQLRRAAADLRQCLNQHTLNVNSSGRPNFEACTAAVSSVQLLTQVLLAPPENLYSGLTRAPAQPEAGLALAGELHQQVATAQLQLLMLLLTLFDHLEIPAPASDQQGGPSGPATPGDDTARNKTSYFEGIVEIEELPDDYSSSSSNLTAQQQLQAQLQQQVLQALLVAALYAADSSTTLSCEAAGQPAAASILPAAAGGAPGISQPGSDPVCNSSSSSGGLSSVCETIVQRGLVLGTPWSGPHFQQQGQQLAEHVLESVKLPSSSSSSSVSSSRGSKHKASTASTAPDDLQQQLQPSFPLGLAEQQHGSGSEPHDQDKQQQQQQQQQQVWCQLLPLLLDQLRDTLLAQHRHRKLQDKGDMVSYTGPSTFQRCLAARQLTWLVQQLQPPTLSEPQTLGLLLPLVLAVADDPSPSVRQYGHAALGWLGLMAGRGGGLQWQAALLREEARRLVVGCEESCWPTAFPAATSLVLALEGKDPRSPTYHSFLLELLQEAERTAYKPQPRLVFMACVARLVPRLGLYVVRHLAALMPLLLEWVHAYDEESSVVALQLLCLLVQQAWPRMGVHAGVIRQHVEQVVRQERVEQGTRAAAGQQHGKKQQEAGQSGRFGASPTAAICSRRIEAGQQLLRVLSCL